MDRIWRVAALIATPLGLADAAGVSMALLRQTWMHGIDLRTYMAGSRAGLRAGWSHVYDVSLQEPLIRPYFAQASGFAPGYWSPFVSPPPLAWLTAPFTALPFEVAWGTWIAVLAAAVVGAVVLIAFPRGWLILLGAVLLLALPKTLLGILNGNAVCLLLAAVAAGWRLLHAGRPVLGGILLGLLILKPQVALLLPPALLVCGWWRAAAAMAITAAGVLAVSVASLGAHGISGWLDLIKVVSAFPDQQSLALPRLLGPVWAAAALTAVAGGLALLTARASRGGGPDLPLAAALTGSLMVTPYINAEDFVLLVLAALLAIRRDPRGLRAAAAGALVVAAFVAGRDTMVIAAVGMAAALLLMLASSREEVVPRAATQ